MPRPNRRFARALAAGAVAALFLSLPAAAQTAGDLDAAGADSLGPRVLAPAAVANGPDAAAPAQAPAAGLAPTLDGARVAVRAPAPAPAPAAMRARGGLQNSQVLMIVGGAAVLLGILVDNDASDVLIIAGAGVGLWGLYQYLKTNQ